MKLLKHLAFASLGLPISGFAASQINLQEFTCSGLQTTNSVSNLTINCDGDLTLKGGTITANGDIMLKASGRIMMDSITVDTPTIINFDATAVDTTPTVALNVSGYVLPGNGLGGMGIGGDIIRPPVVLSGSGWQPLPTPSAPSFCASSNGRVVCTIILPQGISRVFNPGSGNAAGGTIISVGYHGGVQPPPCTESTFRIKQTGERYCPTQNIKFKEDAFLRVVGECSGNPSQFQVSTSQDFPDDSTTVTLKANCSPLDKSHATCLMYNPTTTDGVLSIPTAFTGLLKLARKSNGQITHLHGEVIQQSLDGCNTQIQLKSLSRQ
jgi:hypothetical protein